jgi:hypothetical protein
MRDGEANYMFQIFNRQTEKGKMAVVRVEDGAAEGVICGEASGRRKYVSVVGESKNEKCWLLQ